MVAAACGQIRSLWHSAVASASGVSTVSTRQSRVLTPPRRTPHGGANEPAAPRRPHRRPPGEAEETTASGLVIPDTAKEKPQQGEVLAVGPGRRAENTGELIPLDVKVGDTVVYSKYGGTEITIDGEDLLILNARDVLAKVEQVGATWPRS